MRSIRTLIRTLIGATLLAAASAQAATNVIDFNTNPNPGPAGLYLDIGNGSWRASGGVTGAANDGYLSVTDALGGQASKLVFRDLEPGLVVKSFTFECDLRIGGGTARPADGFSLNFVSSTDPMIINAENGTASSTSDYAGTDTEGSLPEEGGRTGLGIGFDTWQSDPISGVQDVVGISIRVDGVLLTQLPVPLRPGNLFPGGTYDEVPNRNLATNNANYAQSQQTGALSSKDLNGDGVVDGADANTAQPNDPADPTWGDWIENLKWEKFKAEVDEFGKVKITWKGVELTPVGGLTTTFAPIPGRLVFGGRTGGAWEVHHVDNIRLVTIPADFVLIGNATGNPIGFRITVSDSGPAITDTNTIALKFNDVTVTPTVVTKTGGTTTIGYDNLAAPLVAGSTNNKVSLTIRDTRGLQQVADRFFTVPAYQTLPASYAVTGVDTAAPGFAVRWHQVPLTPLFGMENTVNRAEQQLYGLRGANTVAAPIENVPDVINYEQLAAVAGSWNLNTSAGGEYTDKAMPLADVGYTDNIAAEIEAYLHFPEAGVYNLIFNSDDGFRTTISPNINEVLNPFMVGQADVGRGAADTVSTLLIPTAGYYPARSVWFEGGGGASFEWVGERVAPNPMARALINDTLRPSIKAYRTRTGTTPGAVTFIKPFTSSGSPYLGSIALMAELEQGTDAIDQNSITMELNGVVVAATKTPSGTKTTVTYDPPGNLASGTYTNRITFAAGTQQYAGTNVFTIRNVPAVPPSLALPASAVNTANAGFLIKTRQQDSGESMANDTYRGLVHAAGLIGPTNIADLSLFTGPSGYYVDTGVINYDQAAGAAVGFFSTAGGFIDNLVPGIPGTALGTDNFVQEILTVLDLQPGNYAMNVNSDDGFIMTIGHPSEAFTLPVVVGEFSGGRGSGTGVGSGTTFYFNIAQAGLYPARLVWYEGGGGANVEWSSAAIDANGNLGVYTLVNDVATAGHVKAYQYPLTSAGAPYIESFAPARTGRGNRAGANTPIMAVIVDGVNAVVPGTVSLTLDSAAVTLPAGAVTKTGNKTTLNYQPAAAFAAGSAHNVALTYGDRTVNWSFTVNSSNVNASTFFIEAEDFNTGGGQSQAAASVMPYAGGAYSGLSATQLIDYDRGNEDSSPIYRIGEEPSVPMDRTGDRDRGLTEIVVNYKIGWTGAGQWYNYTRNFPAGNYNVIGGLSHGDAATTATRVGASLHRVTSSPTQPNQTTAYLGTFDGPATGGWGNNGLIPLMNTNTSPATLASVNLAGANTVRMELLNGDFDFILFVPEGTPRPRINTPPTIAGGNITITWTGGGTLESATTLLNTGTVWTTTGDSDGSFTAPVPTVNTYWRVRSP